MDDDLHHAPGDQHLENLDAHHHDVDETTKDEQNRHDSSMSDGLHHALDDPNHGGHYLGSDDPKLDDLCHENLSEYHRVPDAHHHDADETMKDEQNRHG